MTEMTIMMQAPTWITRRLPTRVSCSAPMFSLYAEGSQHNTERCGIKYYQGSYTTLGAFHVDPSSASVSLSQIHQFN